MNSFIAADGVVTSSCTSPAITAVVVGPWPLYGMWVIFTPAFEASSSVASWPNEPTPAEAYETGFFFAYSMKPFQVVDRQRGRDHRDHRRRRDQRDRA